MKVKVDTIVICSYWLNITFICFKVVSTLSYYYSFLILTFSSLSEYPLNVFVLMQDGDLQWRKEYSIDVPQKSTKLSFEVPDIKKGYDCFSYIMNLLLIYNVISLCSYFCLCQTRSFDK